jgi:hypothetical protein
MPKSSLQSSLTTYSYSILYTLLHSKTLNFDLDIAVSLSILHVFRVIVLRNIGTFEVRSS